MSNSPIVLAVWSQAWQIAAVALLAVVVTGLFGRRRPHLSLLLWTLVFIKCLTPPLWSCPVGLFSWLQSRVEPTAQLEPTVAAADGELATPFTSADVPAVTDANSASLTVATAAPFVLAIWLTGALSTAASAFVHWRRCRRWIRESRLPGEPRLRALVTDLSRRLGLRRHVDVVLCEVPLGPAVMGISRPTLILPDSLVATRPREQLEAIIAHELIHVRRQDVVLLGLELAAKVLWWFHPLVWYAGRQTARLRERCCDAETVARLGCRPAVYARSLLAVLEHLQVCRGLSLSPGMRPAEVTRRRLETVMREAHTFRRSTPRYGWLLVALAGPILLPGSPLILHSPAASADETSVADKLAELEGACGQAGLTAEESKAILDLAKRVKADRVAIFKLQAEGKLNDAEKRAIEKLVRRFGHPLEKELAKLREVAAEAKLTAEEAAAAEKLALREGLDNQAILRRYDSGQLSAIEKSAVEKIITLKGRPQASEIEKLTAVARQAGLSEQELATLRALATRANQDIEKIKEWKRGGQLSDAELAAIAKLEAAAHRAPNEAGKANKADAFRQVAKLAGLTAEEGEAFLDAVKQASGDEQTLLDAKKAGKLSGLAAAGLKKLESLIGKLEDFVASPHKKEIGKLLEAAAAAGLTTEETTAALKAAVAAKFDIEALKQRKAAGQFSKVESRAYEKLMTHAGH